MNKLREKFSTLVDCGDNRYTSIVQEQNMDKCEQITDDFSIKFIEWKDKEFLDSRIGLMDRGFGIYIPKDGDAMELSTTELQQYFKENVYNK